MRQHVVIPVKLQALANYLYDLLSQQLQRLLHLPSVHHAVLRSKQRDLAVPPWQTGQMRLQRCSCAAQWFDTGTTRAQV